ncbi:carboxymuconolactone decarboxylase family protein [Mixta tenebrionis]|nr:MULTISPECIES: carboxymuconolactone decarboxylase family protein [Mixta]QHM75542.1 hypothetical protein C7M52_01496 [Mixta theicola]
MMKDYHQFDASVSQCADMLEEELPDVLSNFQNMAKAAKEDGALARKTKLLIALGIAVSNRCDPCISRHARLLAECGTSRQEIAEVSGICVSMNGALVLTYAASALEAFDYFTQQLEAAPESEA